MMNRATAQERDVVYRLLFATCLAILAAQIGCVALRSEGPEDHRSWPPAAEPVKPSISLAVYGRRSINGKPEPIPPSVYSELAERCRDVYVSSGLFSEVLLAGKKGDVTVEVELDLALSFSKAMALIWELTLMIVPGRETTEFTCTTTFRDSAGRVRGVLEKKESVVVWEEMLLILAAPFGTPPSATKAALEDLNRSTLFDAIEKGYVRP